MSKVAIPLYRAKKINRNSYIEGDLISYPDNKFSIRTLSYDCVYDVEDIDPSTLSIHFPNMIDKNGKKIFASLSEDGVGGDITKYINLKGTHDGVFKISQHFTLGVHIEFGNDTYVNIERGEWKTFEVIGIHKGDNK